MTAEVVEQEFEEYLRAFNLETYDINTIFRAWAFKKIAELYAEIDRLSDRVHDAHVSSRVW